MAVILDGKETARRVRETLKDKVKEQFGVTLEPEVKFLGKF